MLKELHIQLKLTMFFLQKKIVSYLFQLPFLLQLGKNTVKRRKHAA